MKNLKIKLSKATRLKNELERNIEKDNEIIEKWNSIIEGNIREVDIDNIEENKDIKSEFLIELNIIIQEANFKKAKGEKRPNAYHIKKLSELQKERKHLQMIETTDGQQKINISDTSNKKGTYVKYNAHLKFIDILNRTKKIDTEIQALKNKLSNFNEQFEITLKIDTSLIQCLESSGLITWIS